MLFRSRCTAASCVTHEDRVAVEDLQATKEAEGVAPDEHEPVLAATGVDLEHLAVTGSKHKLPSIVFRVCCGQAAD